jgi:ABC-type transporter Mla subunit MlaD
MKRIFVIALLVAALPVIFITGTGAGGGGESYQVRAIFDDVAAAVPGEDVRVAGATIGAIKSMDVTPENKAAMVLDITDAGFQRFRSDAKCTVRPQSLIGEKFVECETGSPKGQELEQIPDGQPGAGQYLLPVENTSSPIDIDLVNSTMRLPFRQRFAILLGELGAGFAGHGKDLNEIIHRANPALRETDKVLAQLAAENDTLAKLASDSDRALAPLARDRRHLVGFIEQANKVAEATAAKRQDIEGQIERLPEFLRELRPTMVDLGALSDEMTPIVSDLGKSAPDLTRFVLALGPFSRSTKVSLESLGDATDVGGPVLQRARPLVQDLKAFAADAKPVSKNLAELTRSLDRTGGVERIMDYLFFQMTAVNGFDSLGHYLRAGLIVNLCSTYATTPAPGCTSNFGDTEVKTSAASERIPAHQASADSAGKLAARARQEQSAAQALLGVLGGLRNIANEGTASAERDRRLEAVRKKAREGVSPALQSRNETQLLNYLMGNDR